MTRWSAPGIESILHELFVCVRAMAKVFLLCSFEPRIRILSIVTILPVKFGKIVSLSQQLVLWVDTYNSVSSVISVQNNSQKSSSMCRRLTKNRSFSLDRPLLYFSCVAFWAWNLDTFRISSHLGWGCFANCLVIFRCIWEEIDFLKRVVKFKEIIRKYLRFDVPRLKIRAWS